jgi:hypothetical protein
MGLDLGEGFSQSLAAQRAVPFSRERPRPVESLLGPLELGRCGLAPGLGRTEGAAGTHGRAGGRCQRLLSGERGRVGTRQGGELLGGRGHSGEQLRPLFGHRQARRDGLESAEAFLRGG